jgi:hypothetical protein
MLTIRKEQMAVFSQVQLKKFEDFVLPHLSKSLRKQSEALGEAKLRETIQYGIKRAARFGITSERDVYKYLYLLVAFGRDFDTDKELPGAGEILRSRKRPGEKIRALHQAANKHLRQQ